LGDLDDVLDDDGGIPVVLGEPDDIPHGCTGPFGGLIR
jgi:hypothetical protein